MDITEIARDQNPWWESPGHRETVDFLHKRPLFGRVREYLGDLRNGRAAALLGPRQVGKTMILRQLVDDLLDQGAPPGNVTFFDFSDERVVESLSPRDVMAVRPVALASDQPRVFLFDEIQNSDGWQRWLKTAVDESRRQGPGGARFVVTGSAASSLRDGAIESGQGRWDEISIEGLTFAEYLKVGAPHHPDSTPDPRAFQRYLVTGGFPEHVRTESAREARRTIREDIADRAILRDLRRTGVDVDRVQRLFVHLVTTSGGIWNQVNRAGDLDANRKSIADWLQLLEGTRLITRLERDRVSMTKASSHLRAQPKIYASDHGLITAFSAHPEPSEVSEVRSRIFETVVFRHLRELARQGNGSLSYVRVMEDLEMDFVLRYRTVSIGIEVTSGTDVPVRKIDRLEQAAKQTHIDRRLLIYGGLVARRSADVQLVPLHEFLIDPGRYAGEER